MLSAHEDIRHGYEQFRKDHIDRISSLGIAAVAVTMLLFGGFIYLLTFGV